MKKFIASLVVAAFLVPAHAQYMTDVNGRVVSEYKYTDTDGSPYLLNDQWITGTIRTTNDKVVDGVKMKYDIFKDELEYENEGKLYRVGAKEIVEFVMPTGDALYIFRRGFPAVDDQTEASFYRVLHDGNTKMLKRFETRQREEKQYNSATRVNRFVPSENLYILKQGKMHPIKKGDKKKLISLLSDKRKLMEYNIKEQQLNLKSELDMVKVLEEYDAYKAGDSDPR
ncbi:hypothetical protein [Telluribacter sp.]|jgi:hypothetical protein|uniref:hypothetical protein n=1 Tax=Telluribacter sp. TaxID=1978767 RepID=UPI002E1260B2|nr:hypothetical protein [Telluribacter sp.]